MSAITLTPRVSEKSIALASAGVYVFEVPTSANKIQVAQAVAARFKVQVLAVNMMVAKGKHVTRIRRSPGYETNIKKAYVRLRKGQTITLFEGAK